VLERINLLTTKKTTIIKVGPNLERMEDDFSSTTFFPIKRTISCLDSNFKIKETGEVKMNSYFPFPFFPSKFPSEIKKESPETHF
jgi:hypothetical protein